MVGLSYFEGMLGVSEGKLVGKDVDHSYDHEKDIEKAVGEPKKEDKGGEVKAFQLRLSSS